MNTFKKILLFLGILSVPAVMQAQQLYISDIKVAYSNTSRGSYRVSPQIEFEQPRGSYPDDRLQLCVKAHCVLSTVPGGFGIDELQFEIFKFKPGSNPLDPSSTPPIRTVAFYNIGYCDGSDTVTPNLITGGSYTIDGNAGYFCADWNGIYNLDGVWGKTNGHFGFRARVKTNQVSEQAGNINIEQTSAYPGQDQMPILIDVTNIHVVRSSPTVVGKITGIGAQPYNLMYRLSKGATVNITLHGTSGNTIGPAFRTIVNSLPRFGEGIPDGGLTNGDFWDGKNSQGAMMPKGTYVGRINAESSDGYGNDVADTFQFYMELDPLQITDIALKGLGQGTTDMALISYMLTEPATVYLDIYPPGTTFSNINCGARSTSCGPSNSPVKSIMEQQDMRKTVTMYWDGRNNGGTILCDGSYVYALSAVMPSAASANSEIWTSKIYTGVLPLDRGNPLGFLTPSSTVIGSTPALAGLNPFYFQYNLSRPSDILLNIRKTDNTLVRNLVNMPRTPGVINTEVWDGKDNNGLYVSSDVYIAELIVNDPYQCATMRSSTHTVSFLANMFRIADVRTGPLLGGATSNVAVTFQLSQPMWIDLKIYEPETIINPSKWPWQGANAPSGTVVYNVYGIRPGRYNITEYWDGRDESGLILPDGRYPFTLVAYSTTPASNIMYALDQVYGYVDIARGNIIFTEFDVYPSMPQMYSSSDVVKLPPFQIDYSLTRQSSVTIQVLTPYIPPTVVADVVNGEVRDPDMLYSDFWDGRDNGGNYVTGGIYNVRIIAKDISTTLISLTTVQMTIDAYPLRIYDVAISPLTLDYPAVISYQVSETMKVAILIYKPGTTFDGTGQPYPPENVSLVKRIIGVRPARTNISEYWDGTDLTLSRVPDGNYSFKIYASTDTTSISSVDGSFSPTANLADDIIVAEIPVVKTAIGDICEEFKNNSFFYPNPYTGTSGKFKLYVPVSGKMSVKIYNLAGDRVYAYDLGSRSGDTNVEHAWGKVNSSGKTVASGVYIAVFRYESTEGAKEVCQMTKKILIP